MTTPHRAILYLIVERYIWCLSISKEKEGTAVFPPRYMAGTDVISQDRNPLVASAMA